MQQQQTVHVWCADEQWRYRAADRTQRNVQFFKEQSLFHAADAKAVDCLLYTSDAADE